MALYPKARLRLLPESSTQAKIKPRAIIMHSAGGEAELYGWWMNDASKGLESHFWVSREGVVYQYMDTSVRADANGEANSFAISIETQSSVHASEPWDPKQMAAIITLCDWLCDVHNIPRTLMRSPTGSGIAWHVQFGAPGPWTSVRNKVCPGRERIRQTQEVLVPALARTPLPGTPKPSPNIQKGDRGEHVKFLQAMLNIVTPTLKAAGFGNGKLLKEDGVYGNSTAARVNEFERYWNKKGPGQKKPLMQDFIFTPGTAEALAAIVTLVLA